MGWSELAATNAPVEDEPIKPVLRMNILLARYVFFFHLFSAPPTSPVLPTTYLPPPTLNLPPPPTYHLRTPPPLTPLPELDLWSGSYGARAVVVELWSWSCCYGAVELWSWSCCYGAVELELLLWSCCCGVRAGARAPTRPTRPRSGKMLIYFYFFCLFCLKRQATQQALELLLSSGACLLLQHSKLRSFSGASPAPELACCCNTTSSEACLLLQRNNLQSLLSGVFVACKEEGLLLFFAVEKKKAFFFFLQ